jgi:hypothetical protein
MVARAIAAKTEEEILRLRADSWEQYSMINRVAYFRKPII